MAALWLAMSGCSSAPPAPPLIDRVTEQVTTVLRARFEPPSPASAPEGIAAKPIPPPASAERVRATRSLARFYQRRGYRPAWTGTEALWLPRADSLLAEISASDSDGLRPADFHRDAIRTLMEDIERRRRLKIEVPLDRLGDVEVLLTDAFLTLGKQFESGKIRPRQSSYEWYIARHDHRDLVAALEKAVDGDHVAEILRDLLPRHPDYDRLKKALANYREVVAAGGWNLVPPGPRLRLGDKARRVLLLRRRLIAERLLDDAPTARERGTSPEQALASGPADAWVFDAKLEASLKRFQAAHGLAASGWLDRATGSALNVSAPRRVRQIELNLERWRWLPRDFGRRYIIVNTAAFELEAVAKGKVALRMPVVVGNQYKATPVFTGVMSSVTLNPYWFIPKNLAVERILPKARRDPEFLEKNGISVVKKNAKSGDWEVTDAGAIDWEQVSEKAFPLTLRQDPGPANPLGRVKFAFPNRFSIFLHDTPEKELFRQGARSLSNGCIRLSQPMELLKWVFDGDPDWSWNKIHELIGVKREVEIGIRGPIPVHLLYQTAWVDDAGEVQFRADIYGRDELLDQLL